MLQQPSSTTSPNGSATISAANSTIAPARPGLSTGAAPLAGAPPLPGADEADGEEGGSTTGTGNTTGSDRIGENEATLTARFDLAMFVCDTAPSFPELMMRIEMFTLIG